MTDRQKLLDEQAEIKARLQAGKEGMLEILTLGKRWDEINRILKEEK